MVHGYQFGAVWKSGFDLDVGDHVGDAVHHVCPRLHGAAHGSEMAGTPTWSALAGMVMGSALLHGAGVLIGQRMAGRAWLQRSAGGALALMGSSLLVGLV